MPTFETPNSVSELMNDIIEIDRYYKGRRYAYEQYDLYDLVFDRYEYDLQTDEEIGQQATQKANEIIAQKLKEYKHGLSSEKEYLNYKIQNSTSMQEHEINEINHVYQDKMFYYDREALKRGTQSSTLFNKTKADLELERDYKIAQVNAKYLDMNVELNAKLKQVEYKEINAESLFEPQITYEKNKIIEELKKAREEERFNQFKYANSQHEKEIRVLNSLNQARMHLSLEYISIVNEPLTTAELDALGYYKDIIVVMDQYFYTLAPDEAYNLFLRQSELVYYLGDYYSVMREKYAARKV